MGCCPPWSGASGLPSSPQTTGSPKDFTSLQDQHLHLLGEVLTWAWFSRLEPLSGAICLKARAAERPSSADGKEQKMGESRG